MDSIVHLKIEKKPFFTIWYLVSEQLLDEDKADTSQLYILGSFFFIDHIFS